MKCLWFFHTAISSLTQNNLLLVLNVVIDDFHVIFFWWSHCKTVCIVWMCSLVGNVVDMLPTCLKLARCRNIPHSTNISICCVINILESFISRQWPREKYWHFSFINAFLDSLGWEEYIAQKKKKAYSEVFFYPEVWYFLSFSWHVRTCCALVSVSVLLNFEMLCHSTIPTKMCGNDVWVWIDCNCKDPKSVVILFGPMNNKWAWPKN